MSKAPTVAARTIRACEQQIKELEEALHRTIENVAWFNSILKWMLNRENNVPYTLLCLIREGASKRFSEAIMRRGDKVPDKKLDAEGGDLP